MAVRNDMVATGIPRMKIVGQYAVIVDTTIREALGMAAPRDKGPRDRAASS